MSVLLSAVKIKKAKKVIRKQKKKSPPISKRNDGDSRPPCCSEDTDVWYWELEGRMTTVMFGKDNGEVWCNGFLLPTEIREDDSLGFVVNFSIELSGERIQKADLLVMKDGKSILSIDGVMVPQYKTAE